MPLIQRKTPSPEGGRLATSSKAKGKSLLHLLFCSARIFGGARVFRSTRILRGARVFRSARIRGGTGALGLARTAGGDLDGCVAGNACGGGRKCCGAGGKSNNAEGRDGFLDHSVSPNEKSEISDRGGIPPSHRLDGDSSRQTTHTMLTASQLVVIAGFSHCRERPEFRRT